MWMIGPVGFTTPLLLLGLLALPILWFLLRAVPPAPIRRRFPGVALLLGLKDEEAETDKTPWWLLFLRMAAIAAAIIGFAGPVLNPAQRDLANTGPLLVLMDGSWADARDWPRRVDRATTLVAEAGRAGRPVALVRLSDAPSDIVFQAANALLPSMAGLTPNPWAPDFAGWSDALPSGGFSSFWLSDGVEHGARAGLLSALQTHGNVTVFESPRPVVALRPARFEDGVIRLSATRLPATDAAEVELSARGLDPAGIERELARLPLVFKAGAPEAETSLSLPPELRNRINRFELAGIRSAAAVSLTDDSLKRRKVALISGSGGAESLQLLSPTHYLRQALEPVAELIDGTLADVVLANPDVIVLADVATLSPDEGDAILDWLDRGGLLLRFAGPRLAASDVSRESEDPLMPVRLRIGGRNVGGAMSWGEPKSLAPFAEGSPFFGLPIPQDVTVTAQVLAQPDPDLATRTIAALADGTPLVTRKAMGQGQVVLFHVTANAEWSSLPLSGLFMLMLERLAVSTRPVAPNTADLEGQIWVPQVALNAFGTLNDAGDIAGVDGAALAKALAQTGPSATMPPGLYAGEDRRVALNVIGPDTALTATSWPASVALEGLEVQIEQALKGTALSTALSLLLVDVLAALALSGRLLGSLRNAAVLALGLMVLAPTDTRAQTVKPDDQRAIEATTALRLGYILT
ncbi:MAG: BatA domain-containing protein, partial [Pseudorhodobacter sp.]